MPAMMASDLRTGVLLANTGTPDAPTTGALWRYLRQFLSDRRVIDLPRPVWLPVLYGIILNIRPRRSARLYRRIWTPDGSPLLVIMQRLASDLCRRLADHGQGQLFVEPGMRYGNPSIASALRKLQAGGVERIVVLPLFPQYSAVTTGSIFDAVFAELSTWRRLPDLTFIAQYHTHPAYLHALQSQVTRVWEASGAPVRLLFSFHSIPESYARQGDPYPQQCQETARQLAGGLGLDELQWLVGFQSRFGPQEWLKPYTDRVLEQWGKEKLDGVQVLCPGFAVDCLETVDEIGHKGRKTFMQAGGGSFQYLPALNASPEHGEVLAQVILAHLPTTPHATSL